MRNKPPRPPEPTEEVEQTWLFQWATLAEGKYPELAALFHIPNGGRRGKAEAARFKAQGVKAGVPDLCLPVPRGPYHALYIELKRETGGTASAAQAGWIERLKYYGNFAVICHGWESAKNVILWYMKGANDGEVKELH